MEDPPLRERLPGAAVLAVALVLALVGVLGPTLGLLVGVVLGVALGEHLPGGRQRWSGRLMKGAVVALGLGLPLDVVLATARDSLLLTVGTIALALAAAAVLARVLGVERDTATLLGVGTAICGGSAIAAVAPVIRARQEAMVLALAIVFVLNGVDLVLFPLVGRALDLSPHDFGIWAALGIHDTSSVVGAATAFGGGALEVAVTAKLARAVWIIPLVLVLAWRERGEGRPRPPLFIVAFLAASVLRTLVPALADVAPEITSAARHVFAAALVLVGSGITRETLRRLDARPLVMGVALATLLASASLAAVLLT